MNGTKPLPLLFFNIIVFTRIQFAVLDLGSKKNGCSNHCLNIFILKGLCLLQMNSLNALGGSGTAGVRLQGTPVCSGTAMGRACVVRSLEQIGELKHGDILITHSTDVGWSPYFPLLEGVVTELGGLISHGEDYNYFTHLICMLMFWCMI
jgi:hypothetical protein